MKTGKLGKIEINAWIAGAPTSGDPPDTAPPATVNYDTWLGPAPKRPFNENRFHYKWRFLWVYGNTELGNLGVHLLDVVLWGIQTMRDGNLDCLPSTRSYRQLQDLLAERRQRDSRHTKMLTWSGDFALTWQLRSFARHHPINGWPEGITFVGTDGTLEFSYLHHWQVFSAMAAKVPEKKSRTNATTARTEKELYRVRQEPEAAQFPHQLGR